VTEDGERVHDPEEVSAKIAKECERLQGPTWALPSRGNLPLYNPKDFEDALFNPDIIEEAIRQTNPHKGIGPDGFCGLILECNQDLRRRYALAISNALNTGAIPSYLSEAKLVALSKNKGSAEATFDQIRPIAIRSHISKYMEKAILNQI
jgi:hypothetical protein